jgi:cell division septum initiation protein DivIVA
MTTSHFEQLEAQALLQLQQLDSNIDGLKDIIDADFAQLKRENKNLKNSVETLEEQLKTAQQSIASLQATQEYHQNTLLKLVNAFKSVNAKVEVLKTTLK